MKALSEQSPVLRQRPTVLREAGGRLATQSGNSLAYDRTTATSLKLTSCLAVLDGPSTLSWPP